MATVTDTLQTVLVLSGAAAYVAGLNQAARASMQLAASQQGTAAAAGEARAGLAGIAAAAPEILGALAAVKLGFDTVSDAFHAFADESSQLFRTAIIFRNLGVNLPVERLQAFSDALSRTTGLSRAELEGAAGVLARVGVRGEQMAAILKTISDTARGTGHSVEEVAHAIELGAEGGGRRLREYGVSIQDTGSKLQNLFLIQQQLSRNFGGAGAAFLNTPQGALDQLSESVRRFMAALGKDMAPQIVELLQGLTKFFDFLTAHMHQIVDAIHMALGPIAWASRALGMLRPELRNPAAGIGTGRPASESTLQQVADNTRQIADQVEMRVLGGSGAQVQAGFNWMQARHAMLI